MVQWTYYWPMAIEKASRRIHTFRSDLFNIFYIKPRWYWDLLQVFSGSEWTAVTENGLRMRFVSWPNTFLAARRLTKIRTKGLLLRCDCQEFIAVRWRKNYAQVTQGCYEAGVQLTLPQCTGENLAPPSAISIIETLLKLDECSSTRDCKHDAIETFVKPCFRS